MGTFKLLLPAFRSSLQVCEELSSCLKSSCSWTCIKAHCILLKGLASEVWASTIPASRGCLQNPF